MKNNNLVEKLHDKVNKFESNDISINEMNVINIFTHYMIEVHKNLMLYFDESIVNQIYPKMRSYLFKILDEKVKDETDLLSFKIMFPSHIEYIFSQLIKENNIDIFQEGCILENGNFSSLQKFIISNNLISMLIDKNEIVSLTNNDKYICEILDISKLKYKLENYKIAREILKLKKEKAKTMVIKK